MSSVAHAVRHRLSDVSTAFSPSGALGDLRADLLRLALLAPLGAASAYISIPIPHTPLYLDPRWVFGFVGAIIIRRFWLALLLVMVLSVAGFHQVSTTTAFLGNMLFGVPILLTIRLVHGRLLRHVGQPVAYAAGCFALFLLCNQVFTTPLLFGFKSRLSGEAFVAGMVRGWMEQAFLAESIFIGGVGALVLTTLREHTALVLSHRQWTTTFESIGDAVILTDRKGLIQAMNPVAETLTGWRIGQARNKAFDKVVQLEDGQGRMLGRSPVDRAIDEDRAIALSDETVLISRGGRRVHIADTAAPIRDEAGQAGGVVIIFRDVTPEYESRMALRDSEQRFRSFVENANDIVYSLTPAGEFTYISPNWLELMGEAPQAAVGRNFREYVLPEDIHICADFLREVLATESKRSSVDYRVRRVDGQLRWHSSTGSPLRDAAGRVTGYVGIARDITDRRDDAETLQRHAAFLDQTGQLAKVGGWEIDVRAGVSTLSETARELCEVEGEWRPRTEEMIMMSPPESREKLREVYQRALEEGIGFDVEADLITAKGNHRRIRLIGTPEFQDGQCVRIYGATQDITHVHTLETQLRQVQKMEAIGQLAGGVAHDFNNLLTPILGQADLCLTEADKDSELAESLTDIRRAAEQARELTAQLLAFGRKQVLEVRPVDLSQLVRENRRMLRGLIREDIRLEMHLAEDPGRVQADPTQLVQVLMNLTVNALDAMEAGGTLTIETSEAKLDADYVVDHPESRTGPHVLLAVSDTGCGMDEETRSHIFEPFYTTKQERHGTGLGLASVYGIVKQHQGHIRVYSEPGQGTTFKIYLPIDAAAEAHADAQPPRVDSAPSATILLVEDDSAVLKFAAEALGRLGHVVLPAASPTEALERASSSDGIDLLISDVVMPEMKGPELYRRLLDSRPSLPVLYMSGYTANAVAGRQALGPDAVVLSKPFTAEELGRAISEVLASRP